MGQATQALRARLLGPTLELAVERSPFYRERLAGLIERVHGPEDLPLLPTTDKRDLAERGGEMLTSREFPVGVYLSSGTSVRDVPAPPAVVFRSRAELEAAEQLRPTPGETDGDRPLIVDVITSIHGSRGTPPEPGVFLLPLEKPFHLVNLRRWLTTRWSFDGFGDRVEFVVGPLNLVRLLAVALEHTSPEVLPELRLKGVLVHGDHLSATWRERIAGLLGAPLTNVYGLSEVAGSVCMECPACGCFHIPPVVVPEVVPRGPRDEVGELVLTTLAPFQELQPLIRYRTRDLVRLGEPCPLVEERGFVPIGRLTRDSPEAEEVAALLPGYAVHDLVEAEREVRRVPYPRLADFGVPPVYGRPVYELEALGPRSARLVVGLDREPGPREEVEERLASGLRVLSGGEVDAEVRAVGPDAVLAPGPTEKVG